MHSSRMQECSRLPNASSFELGFEIANSYQGKSRVLPVLHWIRSSENPPNWNTETISIYEWWPSGKQSEDFIKTATTVEQILTGYPIKNPDQMFKSVLFVGIDSYCKNQRRELAQKRNRIRLVIRKIIGLGFSDARVYNIKNRMAKFLNLQFLDDRWLELPALLDSLNSQGIKASEDSLQTISHLFTK